MADQGHRHGQPSIRGCRISHYPTWLRASLVAQSVKICLQRRRPGFDYRVGKIPWRRERLPSPLFWPGEFHGQRSLMGYSPWGHKESDTTERLSLHHMAHHSLCHLLTRKISSLWGHELTSRNNSLTTGLRWVEYFETNNSQHFPVFLPQISCHRYANFSDDGQFHQFLAFTSYFFPLCVPHPPTSTPCSLLLGPPETVSEKE